MSFTVYVNGSVKDLTDCAATLAITESATDSDAVITLTGGSGLTLGGNLGTIAATISATNTAALTIGKAHYRLSITESDTATKYRYAEGDIMVQA